MSSKDYVLHFLLYHLDGVQIGGVGRPIHDRVPLFFEPVYFLSNFVLFSSIMHENNA